MSEFEQKVAALKAHHEALLSRKNTPVEWGNGIYEKYQYPVVTAEHVPLEWKYDFNEQDNPYLMQRIMCNAALNSGAIMLFFEHFRAYFRRTIIQTGKKV